MNIEDAKQRATITVPEAGELLGIGRDAAYAAANRGEIPVLRLGRRIVVPVPALLAMLGATESGERVVPPAPYYAGVSMADAERIAQRHADGQSPCKARQQGGSRCPHPAMPGSDYCRMHAGVGGAQ